MIPFRTNRDEVDRKISITDINSITTAIITFSSNRPVIIVNLGFYRSHIKENKIVNAGSKGVKKFLMIIHR